MGEWWRDGVLYQIYPRSFADTNGDGVGDLAGVVEHLDHLAWLGIDGIWLNPVMPSPNADWGYDVSDYTGVHPELGTLADVDRLVAEAARRGIRVLFDIVPNHTSDRHPWFLESRASRQSPRRDWYHWVDRPNNWLSVFGGPAWTLDQQTGQYYLHQFLPEQPDLNWWTDGVRDAFDEILRFWFDRGIAGFRIDVAHAIVKDRELRENPPLGPDDDPALHPLGYLDVYNVNRPEVHDVFRRWRTLSDRYDPPRVLVGETHVREVSVMASYYGGGDDELHLAFNFPFVYSPLDADALADVVADTEAAIPLGAWPVWTASNHDAGRFPSRWCDGHAERARAALLALLMLRGTPVLYYGDEIGMTEPPLRYEDLRDPVGLRHWPENRGRDACRTPMQWSAGPGAGFADPATRPWLPLGDHASCNVEDQRGDPDSTLNLCRDLIALRRELGELRDGAYARLDAPAGAWAWVRGEHVVVAVNLSDRDVDVDGVEGSVRVATVRARDGERVRGRLALGPWEGAVVEAGYFE